tara:strand:- start:896 stop:1372 length:477 start_codon:yes stop_codon:yes gene_type:complete
MTKLFRERDGLPVTVWEDREKKQHKELALTRLAFVTAISKKAHSNIRKRWNLTLDHRIISSLAIAARYHELPPYILNYCKLDQRPDLVNMSIVNNLCNGSKDTVLKIVKEGIENKELCQVQNPPRYRGLIFTAGYTMMKAFEDKVEDIARMQKVEANY